MRPSLTAALVCAAIGSCVSAQPSRPAMTNVDVARMVQSGVAEDIVITAIYSCEPRFLLMPGATDGLTKAGVSDKIIRAMAAVQHGSLKEELKKELKDEIKAVVAPQQKLQTVTQPVKSKPVRERPNHWGMLPGQPEVGIGGGISTTLPDASGPFGVFSFDAAVGVNRYVAGIGSITRHSIASTPSVQVCISTLCANESGSLKLTEAMAGVKVSASNRSRVTPFATGVMGIATTSLNLLTYTEVGDVKGSGSLTKAAFGGGVGVEANATRNVGFRFEARTTHVLESGWFMRANFGVFFRFGR